MYTVFRYYMYLYILFFETSNSFVLVLFNRFGVFKTHVRNCFESIDIEDEQRITAHNDALEAYNTVIKENERVTRFKESARGAALDIALKLNANMMLPRSFVYETMDLFKNFLKMVANGML